jgi:hypothetical protein
MNYRPSLRLTNRGVDDVFLSATDEINDFHGIALVDEDLREPLTLENGEIVFDGNAARVDVELRQQVSHAHGTVELESFAVQGNLHRICGIRSERTALKRNKSR